jgi:hypothetical protein
VGSSGQKFVIRNGRSTSIPAGRSVTSHVETLAAETLGLTRPLILERGSIVFRRASGNGDRLRTIYFTKAYALRVAPAGMCVSTLPRQGSRIILQTSAADFLSKISDGGDPQDFQFVRSGIAHAGGHRSRRMWFWPWISFPSRRSFIQSWR